MNEWFDEKLFLKYISNEKNRDNALRIIREVERSEIIESNELKDYAALTIKDSLDLKRIQNYFKENNRNAYITWLLGQNTGLRGSDVVKLTIYDLRKAIKFRKMIVVEEKVEHIMTSRIKNKKPVKKKTRREIKRTVYLNNKLINILKEFVYGKPSSDFIYPTNSKLGHIRRDSLGKVYRRALLKLKIANENDVIGTHTPRKTYGYMQYVEHDNDINYVQNLFCHSVPKTTRVYIGLDEVEREESAGTMDKHTY
ncbi:tyrosine-type recombinase/integrase [Vallitalea guaymasensis]|uniref:tyrosine-type recombinase/integrase n=1 Tax=Vallitalea guaymasensis TaxID=1185412 RepID=UPI000DE220C8|nr:tyrosine-type recombinase/integrase [Vallitalea guaymasensis]